MIVIDCIFGKSRKIMNEQGHDKKFASAKDYANNLGVYTGHLGRADEEKMQELIRRIKEFEKETRATIFSFLFAITATINGIATWIAIWK